MQSQLARAEQGQGRSAGAEAMLLLWPAFVMAGLLEMLVFSVVDPESLRVMGNAPLDWSPLAVYSVAFLAFWTVIALAGWMTHLLRQSMPRD